MFGHLGQAKPGSGENNTNVFKISSLFDRSVRTVVSNFTYILVYTVLVQARVRAESVWAIHTGGRYSSTFVRIAGTMPVRPNEAFQ